MHTLTDMASQILVVFLIAGTYCFFNFVGCSLWIHFVTERSGLNLGRTFSISKSASCSGTGKKTDEVAETNDIDLEKGECPNVEKFADAKTEECPRVEDEEDREGRQL